MQLIQRLWIGLLRSGTQNEEADVQRAGITRGVNLLSALIILINMAAGPLFAAMSGAWLIFVGSMSEILGLAMVIMLNHFNRQRLAGICLFCILNVVTFFFGAILGPQADVQLMIVLLIGLTFFVFERKIVRSVCILASVLLLAAMELNFKFQLIPAAKLTPLMTDMLRWLGYVVSISLLSVLFYLFSSNFERVILCQKVYADFIKVSLDQERHISIKKNSFIRMAYHEVRSQFRGVKMMIAVLNRMEEVREIAGLEQVLKDIKAGSEYIEQVMNNMLEWSASEAGVAEKNVYELVRSAAFFESLINIARYEAGERKIKVCYTIMRDVDEYILTDRIKLAQIITNLLSNALKFSYAGGTIFLMVGRVSDRWQITVRDEGKGIAPDRLHSIFNPFVTEVNRSNIEGMGLGLTICKRLAGLLKGDIEVISTPGEGSRFIVTVPIVQAEEADGVFHYATVSN